MRRLFLAVPVPGEVAEYRLQLQEANKHIEGIKWMRLHNLHLTGYFIGNIPAEEADEVVNTIRPAITSQEEFTLGFEKIAFAPSRDPRMIWGRYMKHPSFSALSENIHNALGERMSGNKFYHKDPVPHITLARFHHKVFKKSDINIPPVTLPDLHVNALELWESKSSPEGVKYERVMRMVFG